MTGRQSPHAVRTDTQCRQRQSLMAKEDIKLPMEVTEDISTYIQELCRGSGQPRARKRKAKTSSERPTIALQAEVILQLWQFVELRRSSMSGDITKDPRNPSEWLSPSKLQALERAFVEYEEEHGEGLDMAHFVNVWHERVSDRIVTDDLEKLFMKIDCERTKAVSWSDYISYTVVETLKQDFMKAVEKLKPYPKELKRVQGQRERDVIMRVEFVQAAHPATIGNMEVSSNAAAARGRYVTVSRDGNLNYWSTAFKRLKTISLAEPEQISKANGYVYVSDMVNMADVNILAISFVNDRAIRFYGTLGGKFEKSCTLSHLSHVPLCMECIQDSENTERCTLLYGDNDGNVTILKFKQCSSCGPFGLKLNDAREVYLPDVISGSYEQFVEGMVLERLHDDWVVRIKHFRSLGRDMFISCSRSSNRTMYVGNTERRGARYFSVRRGVLCFDYCHSASTIAAGCSDGTVRVLNPYSSSNQPGIVLTGHQKPVSHVAIDEKREYVVTIATDKTIIVFCLKENVPVQCIDPKHINMGVWPITSIYLNTVNDSLIIATNYLGVFEQPGHSAAPQISAVDQEHYVVACLYNKLFQTVATADTRSSISIWNIVDGSKVISFHNAHTTIIDDEVKPVEISCMSFDSSGRRLITGAVDGSVHLWNFNNGALLRRLCEGGSAEVAGLACVGQKDMIFVAFGSDRQITCFVDNVDPKLRHVRRLARGHRSEILCLAYDRSWVATGAQDGDILIWSLGSEHPVLRLNAAKFSKPYTLPRAFANEHRRSQQGANAGGSAKGAGGYRSTCRSWDYRQSLSNPRQSLLERQDAATVAGSDDDDDSPSFSPSPSASNAAGEMANSAESLKEQLTFNRLVTERIYKYRKSGTPGRSSIECSQAEATRVNPSRDHCEQPGEVPTDSDGINHDKTSVDLLLFLGTRVPSTRTATLMASGAEGWVRAWSVVSSGGLLGQFNACHCRCEPFVKMATDGKNEFLFTGDPMGYIKVWDLSEYCLDRSQQPRRDTAYVASKQLQYEKFIFLNEDKYDHLSQSTDWNGRADCSLTAFRTNRLHPPPMPPKTSDPDRTLNYPKLLNSFRGHVKAITSIAINDEKMLLITASSDQTVRVWTIYGSFIGQFAGGAVWSLGQDLSRRPVKPPSEVVKVASYTTLKVLKRGVYPRWQTVKKICLANAAALAFITYRKDNLAREESEAASIGHDAPSGPVGTTADSPETSRFQMRSGGTRLFDEGPDASRRRSGERTEQSASTSRAPTTAAARLNETSLLTRARAQATEVQESEQSLSRASRSKRYTDESSEAKPRADSEDFLPTISGRTLSDTYSAAATSSLFRVDENAVSKRRGSLRPKLPELRHTGTHVAVYHALPYVELQPLPTFPVPAAVQELLMTESYMARSRRTSLRTKSTPGALIGRSTSDGETRPSIDK